MDETKPTHLSRGNPCSKKYVGLRRPGETDDDVVARLYAEAAKFGSRKTSRSRGRAGGARCRTVTPGSC